tara:strand:+ start:232 stop:621 length:390 start_codon:yes stop_codon:yes gene_type:complete
MSKVHTFNTKIEDEYGVYPSAVVAIIKAEKTASTGWGSVDGVEDYTHSKPSIGMLEYTASYYQSVDAQLAGKRSRPLLSFSSNLPIADRMLHSVNLAHEESERIMNGGLNPMELDITLIQHDIERNFNF